MADWSVYDNADSMADCDCWYGYCFNADPDNLVYMVDYRIPAVLPISSNICYRLRHPSSIFYGCE